MAKAETEDNLDDDERPFPKLGRWVYCKYCYKSVRPAIRDDLVVCSECDYGLAPLGDVAAAGSYAAWYDRICEEFYSKFKKEPAK